MLSISFSEFIEIILQVARYKAVLDINCSIYKTLNIPGFTINQVLH